jgi:hypothetical protein
MVRSRDPRRQSIRLETWHGLSPPAFAALLALISPPYAEENEKNSLFYFLSPCYPINSRKPSKSFIPPKIHKDSKNVRLDRSVRRSVFRR